MGSETRRPLGRFILCLGVLLLGCMAALRLPLSYLPSWSFPELRVSLSLPQATELGDMTRTWIEPLEAAVRATGGVRSTAGEIDTRGGAFRIRFAAGTDVESKAARLESEIGALRRRLPRGASLRVQPRSQGDNESSMVLWLKRHDSAARFDATLLDVLKRLPEVRDVQVMGRPSQEIQLRSTWDEVDAQQLDHLVRHLSGQPLGEVRQGGQRIALWSADARDQAFDQQLLRLGHAVLPLAAVTQQKVRAKDPSWMARHMGRPGWVLFVQRELEASPLALERSVLRTLADQGISSQVFLSEAEPLRVLLVRLALAMVAAGCCLALGGGWLGGWLGAGVYGLALPLALAAALNGYWLADIPLDLTTLPTLAVALAGSLAVLILRRSRLGPLTTMTQMAAAVLLPVAVALASGSLAPLLEAPARAFLVAVVAAVPALWLLPLPAGDALPGMFWRRTMKLFLRRAWTVVLLAVTATYLLMVMAGRALSPRPGSVPAALIDLAIFVQLPEGSTLDQAASQVGNVERHLAKLEEVEDYWSVFNRQEGTLGVTLRARDRRLSRLRPLQRRLQSELGHIGAAISLVPFASGGRQSSEALRFDDSLEDRATFDTEEAYTYRCILRSTDLEGLLRSHDRVIEEARRLKQEIWPHLIRSEWRQPTLRVELVPRPGADATAQAAAVESLRSLASPSQSHWLETDDSLSLRLLDIDAPEREDDVPQRWHLMSLQNPASPLALGQFFDLRERLASPGIRRQGGRYVLPVSMRLRGEVEAGRRANAGWLQHRLRSLRLASSVDLELPDIGLRSLRRERLRLWSMAAALPLLMWALAACRLSSLSAATAALAPATLGLAAATPWLLAVKGHIDEMTLLGLAAALVACLPLSLEVAAELPVKAPMGGGAVYRWLLVRWRSAVLLAAAMAVLLASAGWGLDADRHPWVLPLRGAAVTMAVTTVASFVLLPLLLQGLQRWKERNPEEQATLRRPPVWRQPGEVTLSARHLTKVYNVAVSPVLSTRGAKVPHLKALDGLDFDLRPGIIGLLGPNGAGKTTLLRLLCGLIEPSRGQVVYRGQRVTAANLSEYRRLVGFLPQFFNAYEGMTAEGFLDYWALEKGILDPSTRRRHVAQALADVGLSDAARRHVRQFSGGMRRRIGIARALLGDPPILIVDEPTTGLDVESRNRLRETLLSVAGERIIIFSTHIASDIAAAASRILILHGGRLLYDGTAEALIRSARGRVFEALLSDAELRRFSRSYRVTTRVRVPQGIRVRAVTSGGQEARGSCVEATLEEAYLVRLGENVDNHSGLARERAVSLLDIEAWRSR